MNASIEVRSVTKRFGPVTAVEDLSFTVQPGRVTGFLGPNGAGKTTTLRILLDLVQATSGTATFGGQRYRDLTHPLASVGAALEAASFHPGRSARGHLQVQATAAGISRDRVEQVLAQVGMTEYADRRVGGYSLGMRQRLGLASALLGDPQVLVLDEPTNGLDPEGIRWTREFLRAFAVAGRTVLVSSHLLSEVQQMVDDVVILTRGRLVWAGRLHDLEATQRSLVRVDSPDRAGLHAALAGGGLPTQVAPEGHFLVEASTAVVGRIVFAAGIELSLLAPASGGLEELFLQLTGQQR